MLCRCDGSRDIAKWFVAWCSSLFCAWSHHLMGASVVCAEREKPHISIAGSVHFRQATCNFTRLGATRWFMAIRYCEYVYINTEKETGTGSRSSVDPEQCGEYRYIYDNGNGTMEYIWRRVKWVRWCSIIRPSAVIICVSHTYMRSKNCISSRNFSSQSGLCTR